MVLTLNQLICQNHEENFFQILCVSQKVQTLQNNVFSTKNGPINVDGHVYKISDLDKTYFSDIF